MTVEVKFKLLEVGLLAELEEKVVGKLGNSLMGACRS